MDSPFKGFGREGLYIEYKAGLPSPPTLAKSMISFSNTKGGRIIMGVEDKTWKICGVNTNLDIEEYIMNIAAQNCDPIISPVVEFHSYNSKLVIIIDVPAGSFKPYHLKSRSIEESAYIRIGSTNRLADKDHIQSLMREAVHESFDRLPVAKTTEDDLNFNKIEHYQELKSNRLGTPAERPSSAFLKKIGVKKEAKPSSPVNCGGLLIFGKLPQSIPALSRASIKVARFKGKEVGNILDHDTIEGTLDEQIERATQFIRKHMFVSGGIIGLKREDKATYPLAAVREIITNAVVHRDYARARGESIMCRIFDDRLEVESPGLLPIGVRVENLGEVQCTRNPLIARLMFDMHYFDEWGQGIKRVIQTCSENGNLPPRFEEKDTTFMVTICARREILRYSLKERRASLLDYLKRAGEITSKGYQALTGISPAQAVKDFNQFLKEGIIKREGKGRGVTYHP